MNIKHLRKKFELSNAVVAGLIVVVLILGLIDLAVDWSTGFGASLSDTFSRLGSIFDFGSWSSLSTIGVVSNFLILTSFVVWIVLLVGWVLLAIFKKHHEFFIGATLHAVGGFILVAYLVNAIPVHDALLGAGTVLSYFLIVFVVLMFIAMAFLLAYTIIYTHKKEEISVRNTTVVQHKEEKTVVEEYAGDTIIVNNYYGNTGENSENQVTETVYLDKTGYVDGGTITDKNKYNRKPFIQQLAESDQTVRDMYNELKADFLSYGIKSRISKAGDTFRLHTKAYARIKVAGKGLKVYYALDPKAYADSPIPVKDSGSQKAYKEIPLTFRAKSDLSIRRAKQLIADACAVDGITEQEDLELHTYDWASDAILSHYNHDDDGTGEI